MRVLALLVTAVLLAACAPDASPSATAAGSVAASEPSIAASEPSISVPPAATASPDAPTLSPAPTQSSAPTSALQGAATSFDEYATAYCSAWGTLFRVVGNPETAGWTDTVHELQAASEARDDATAARIGAEIIAELEAARRQIALAAGWEPAARAMAHMDRFFVATETWITAHVDVAKGVPNAPQPQAAFEAAGALEAWQGMFEASADLAPHRPASVAQCSGAPIVP